VIRLQRLGLILLVIFMLVVGGGPYYAVYLPVRVVTHALLTAVLLGWLVTRIRRGRFLPATPLNWPLYAGAGVLALSTLFSLDPRMSAEHAWWPLVHGLIFFVCAAVIADGRQRLLFEALFLAGAVTVLLAGAEFVGWAERTLAAVDVGAVLAGQSEFPPITPMLGAPLHVSTALAGFVTPQIVIAFAWAVTARRRDERMVLLALGVALGLVLLGTGSRGGFLSLAAAAVVLTVLRLAPAFRRALGGDGGSRRRVFTGAAAIVFIACAALGLVLVISRGSGRSSGDAIRASLWADAAYASRDYPVLGAGTGQFGRVARIYQRPDDPVDFRHRQAHNIVLNTAAEEGIAGVFILGWMSVALVIGWWRLRRTATGSRALRLDAALAALAAVAVQAQFDVFFTTPFVALVALLAAYAVTPDGAFGAQPRPPLRDKAAAWVALALVAAGGLLWIPVNLAQAQFERSVREQDMNAARQAAALDPALHLYRLHIAYLTGVDSAGDPAQLPEAIAEYEAALALEPTWDTGWINLAGLYERAGRIDDALAALERARIINPRSAAGWNWARIADEHDAAPDDAIIAAYGAAMRSTLWPFSTAWAATPRRLQALEQIYADANPRLQYQLAEVFFPERRAALVPDQPESADDWWVVGQHALTVLNDPQAAFRAFDEAVRLNPNREVGEYYAARARGGAALGESGRDQAQRDAAMASLLVTYQERPAVVFANLAEAQGVTAEALRGLRAAAGPALVIDQNFEGVLFGRVAEFMLPPQLRPPGPGTRAFAPWYAIAADDVAAGELERAANVYRVILEAAPEEALALERLAELQSSK
jgi:tetratricopeptide (TPR) repeat protein